MVRGALCATSPDRHHVLRRNGDGTWTQILDGYDPFRIIGTPAGLVASFQPATYGPGAWLYQPEADRSLSLYHMPFDTGQDSYVYAGTRRGLFRLLPGHGVEHFDVYGGGEHWRRVGGGPATALVGGSWGLVDVDPLRGTVYHYKHGDDLWDPIGDLGTGTQVAVTADNVYALPPGGSAVLAYDNGVWNSLPAPRLGAIQGGVWGLVGIASGSGDLYHYLNVPGEFVPQWKKIGGPGAMFTVGDTTVYALTPNRDAVHEYQPASGTWSVVGGPATEIAFCGGVDPLP